MIFYDIKQTKNSWHWECLSITGDLLALIGLLWLANYRQCLAIGLPSWKWLPFWQWSTMIGYNGKKISIPSSSGEYGKHNHQFHSSVVDRWYLFFFLASDVGPVRIINPPFSNLVIFLNQESCLNRDSIQSIFNP